MDGNVILNFLMFFVLVVLFGYDYCMFFLILDEEIYIFRKKNFLGKCNNVEF